MMTHLLLGESSSTTLGTSIFVAASMLILTLCIKKFAWGSIIAMLKQREDKIANDIDMAEASRKKAESLATQREKELQHSKADALTIINEAKNTAEKNRQSVLLESKNETIKMKEKARSDMELEKEQTMNSVKQEVAEMSIQIAEKILQKELSETAHKELINSYIEGLEK